MVRSVLAAVWLLGFGAAGCTTSKAMCDAEQEAARAKVEQVITSHLACTVDSDCVVVAFAASCFDSCTSVLAASAKADFQAAIADVNAHECQTANDDGCTFFAPPCVGRAPATCPAGVCQ
jgi:hypothetical protein